MSKRADLVRKYAADLEGLGITVDDGLLEKCVKACGPSIYNADAETVAATDKAETDRVRDNFVMKRLGITDVAEADAAVDAAIEAYGRSNRNKYRPVMYYLIATALKREAAV